MKRMVLALMLAVAGLAVSEASARHYYNGYNNGRCGLGGCAPRACAPCAPRRCQPNYKIIDVPACEAPCCVRWVKVKEPAICIRECRWVCPDNCATEEPGANQE